MDIDETEKKVAILGSTGSIGVQALEVIREHTDVIEVYALAANNNVELLIKQAREFRPKIAVISNEQKYKQLKEALKDLPIEVRTGENAVLELVREEPIQTVLMAIVGFAGLKPTINAIKARKTIALANKEVLVVAGEYITQLAEEYDTQIVPVDSEHSTIFQCLRGESRLTLEKIILTASGGPFRTFSIEQLAKVTKKEALKHPNWKMGDKITIDSATLINKGFEIIEAKWLFYLRMEQIQVLIHPQSIIHSMVQFWDGSIKAQLGLPDMRIPIQYALTNPFRTYSDFERIDFTKCATLTFEEPDTSRFRNLALAHEAAMKGGNLPCILNAANEIAVAAFLEDKIGFLEMSEVIEKAMEQIPFVKSPGLEDYLQTDEITRAKSNEIINKLKNR